MTEQQSRLADEIAAAADEIACSDDEERIIEALEELRTLCTQTIVYLGYPLLTNH